MIRGDAGDALAIDFENQFEEEMRAGADGDDAIAEGKPRAHVEEADVDGFDLEHAEESIRAGEAMHESRRVNFNRGFFV